MKSKTRKSLKSMNHAKKVMAACRLLEIALLFKSKIVVREKVRMLAKTFDLSEKALLLELKRLRTSLKYELMDAWTR